VKGVADDQDILIVERRVDPNVSHPMRQKDILAKVGLEVGGIRFSAYTFQAIVWKNGIKNKAHLCWRPAVGGSPQYSSEVVAFIKKLPKQEIEIAVRDYAAHNKTLGHTRKKRKQRAA